MALSPDALAEISECLDIKYRLWSLEHLEEEANRIEAAIDEYAAMEEQGYIGDTALFAQRESVRKAMNAILSGAVVPPSDTVSYAVVSGKYVFRKPEGWFRNCADILCEIGKLFPGPIKIRFFAEDGLKIATNHMPESYWTTPHDILNSGEIYQFLSMLKIPEEILERLGFFPLVTTTDLPPAMIEPNPIATSQPQEPEEPQVQYYPPEMQPAYQLDPAVLAAFNARFDALASVLNALCGLLSRVFELQAFGAEYESALNYPVPLMAYPAKAGALHGNISAAMNAALESKLGTDYRLALDWSEGGQVGLAWANLKYEPITDLVKTLQEFFLQAEMKMRSDGNSTSDARAMIFYAFGGLTKQVLRYQQQGMTCEGAFRRVAAEAVIQLNQHSMPEFISDPAELSDLFVGFLQQIGDAFKSDLNKLVSLLGPRLTNALNFVMSSQFEQSGLTYFRAALPSTVSVDLDYGNQIAGVESVLSGRAQGDLMSGLDDFRGGCQEAVQIIQHILASINEVGVALSTTRAEYTSTPWFQQVVAEGNRVLSIIGSVLDSMLIGDYASLTDEYGNPLETKYPSGVPTNEPVIAEDVTDLSNSLQTNAPTNELVNSSSRINTNTEQVVDTGALKTSTTATLSVQTDASLAPAATKATKDMSATAFVVVGLLLLSILGGDKKR